jgi:hypothetical protein
MTQSGLPQNTPQIVPEFLILGDLWNWVISHPLYNPPAYTLKYYFNILNPVNGTPVEFEIDTTQNGNLYWAYFDSTTVPSGAVGGEYKWASRITGTDNGTTIKETYQRGVLTLFPDPSAASDQRTQEEMILDALNAMILNTASLDQQEYTIGDRHIRKIDRKELFALRNHYKAIVIAQRKKLSFDSGNLKADGTVRIRFTPTYGYGGRQGRGLDGQIW